MLRCGITGSSGNLGKTFLKNKKFYFIKFKGDITKKKIVDRWVRKNNFDILVHLAAIVPTREVNYNYKKALKVNFNGTKNLTDSIKKNKKNIKWFFFASTSHVYPYQKKKIKENFRTNPISKYGKTKLLAENYIKKKLKNINFCIGRIFSIIDNKNKSFLIPNIKKKLKSNSEVVFFDNLNHYRDFLSTKEISKIILHLWKKNFSGTINIASGRKINIQFITKNLAAKIKKRVKFIYNKPTNHVANISKLHNIGYKTQKQDLKRFF